MLQLNVNGHEPWQRLQYSYSPCCASFANLRIELGVPGGVGCGVVFGDACRDPLVAVLEHRT